MEIDINAVTDRLAKRIGDLEVQNALANAALEQAQARVAELEAKAASGE